MKNKRILIITGGYLSIEFARNYLKNQAFDTVIAVDSGLAYVSELNIDLQYIVGDFDSVPKEYLVKYQNKANTDHSINIIKYNPEKDETDTQIAIELGIQLGADEITLLGATGTRLDHLLANVQLLSIALEHNIKAYIVDEYNKLYFIDHNTTLRKDQLYGPYLSLIPYTEVVEAVTLEGFKYPLLKRDLRIGASIGISNEVIAEEAAIIFQSGILIVTESKD
jgi:thiamine pyrophosphokinase